MARAKIVTFGRNKAGKLVKTSKVVVKGAGADANAAMQASGMSKSKTAGQLRSQQLQNEHAQKMAQIAGRTTNTAAAIGTIGQTINNAFNSFKPMQTGVTQSNTTSAPSSVQSLVEGGAESASNSRDDDDDGYADIA